MQQQLDEIKTDLGKLSEKVDNVLKAFPDSDIEGHRRYHELIIEDMAERRRLRQAIKEKTISGLLWAVLVWLGYAVLHEIQRMFLKWVS